MGHFMISEHRISKIKDVGVDSDSDYIIYWMQAAQRICDNHALEFAIRMANNLSCPLVVAFVIMPNFPNANLRHFTFMLQGISEIQEDFKSRGIGFVVRIGKPSFEIVELAQDAKLVVFDAGYSVYERTIRTEIAQLLNKDIYQVRTPWTTAPVAVAKSCSKCISPMAGLLGNCQMARNGARQQAVLHQRGEQGWVIKAAL